MDLAAFCCSEPELEKQYKKWGFEYCVEELRR